VGQKVFINLQGISNQAEQGKAVDTAIIDGFAARGIEASKAKVTIFEAGSIDSIDRFMDFMFSPADANALRGKVTIRKTLTVPMEHLATTYGCSVKPDKTLCVGDMLTSKKIVGVFGNNDLMMIDANSNKLGYLPFGNSNEIERLSVPNWCQVYNNALFCKGDIVKFVDSRPYGPGQIAGFSGDGVMVQYLNHTEFVDKWYSYIPLLTRAGVYTAGPAEKQYFDVKIFSFSEIELDDKRSPL
jgi:hypothetical protein